MEGNIIILNSARKHGVSDDDIVHVLNHYDDYAIISEDNQKLIYIGYDMSAQNREIITIEKHNSDILVIHAMKARKATIEWFQKRRKNG